MDEKIEAMRHNPMHMSDYVEHLDRVLASAGEQVLIGAGNEKVSPMVTQLSWTNYLKIMPPENAGLSLCVVKRHVRQSRKLVSPPINY